MICQRTMVFGLALAMLLTIGCGKSGTTPTVKVTGTVTFSGAPVAGAVVGFTPEQGRPASGTTDASGKFTLSTFETGDGAVLGKHAVTITDSAEAQDEGGEVDYSLPSEAAPGRFSAKYADPATSGFSAEVSKDSHEFTFDMTDK